MRLGVARSRARGGGGSGGGGPGRAAAPGARGLTGLRRLAGLRSGRRSNTVRRKIGITTSQRSRELVVANDRVAVGARFADAAEAREHRVGAPVRGRATVVLPLFREDRHLRVDDLEDVIGTDGEGVVGRIASAEAIEAGKDRDRRP